MTEAHPRDYLTAALAGVLFVLLLVTVREILSPPIVLPFLIAVLWPLRDRPGARWAMVTAAALTLFWLLHRYAGLLGPFALAIAIAYAVAPLVDKVESRRVPRGVAILLVVVPPVLALAALGVFAVPQLWQQSVTLVGNLPRVADSVMGFMEGLRQRLELLSFLTAEQRDYVHQFDAAQLTQILQQNGEAILGQLGDWALTLVKQLATLVGFLGYIVLTPVVAFYLLRDWRQLLAGLESLIPPSRRPPVVHFLNGYDTALGRFIRGQLTEAALVGTLTGVGLAILGVPNALLLGVIAGLCNVIPFVGFVIALAPALLVALTMPSPASGLLRVGAVFAVVQFIDGNVTGPRIVGGSVGLHPVVIMLALALGGAILGFVGLLLAVPLAVLVKMVGELVLERYRGSEVYSGR